MYLSFHPIRDDTPLTLERQGDRLIIDGVAFDFSSLPEGGDLLPEAIGCDRIAGPVTRRDGRLHVALFLPHGAHAPQQSLFPAPLEVSEDGPVALPPHDRPSEESPV